MLKTQIEWLRAQIGTLEGMLAERTPEEDPISFLQYPPRIERLRRELAELEIQIETRAELGLFFDGGPVQDGRGINADFAGRALSGLQSLVAKRYAVREASSSARGRVAANNDAALLVTGTLPGSFGFTLEEPHHDDERPDASLKETVEEVADILASAGMADEARFEDMAATLDDRSLGTLKQLLQLLDENQATLRMVQGRKDFTLDRAAVALAKTRTQAMEIREEESAYRGTLYLLPASRRFDLVADDGGVISGLVGARVMRQLEGLEDDGAPAIDARAISSRPWSVSIRTRSVLERGRTTRQLHTLMRLVDGGVVSAINPVDN